MIANYLTTKEVAKELGVTPCRVRQFVEEGRLVPVAKISNAELFELKKVREFKKLPRKPGRKKLS